MADGMMRGQKTEGARRRPGRSSSHTATSLFCCVHVAPAGNCRVAASRLLFPVICLLSSALSPLNAEELADPTRPPKGLAAPAIAPASGVVTGRPAGLQSIIISKTRRAAIIGGETVELGGKYGDAKLIEVNEGGVVLRSAQGQQVMTLFPDVKIAGRQETKTRPQSPADEVQSGRRKTGPVMHKEGK